MKRGMFFLALVFLITIISFSFISSFSFSDWSKITGKAVEEGSCSGNVLSCDFYSLEYTCNNVNGCSWNGNLCGGTPIQCGELTDKSSCKSQPGCEWYDAPKLEETESAQTSVSPGQQQESQTPPQVEFSNTGYIIEFQDEPVLARKARLEKEAKDFEELRQRNPVLATLLSPFRVSLDEVSGEVKSYSENLRKNHNQAKQQITNRISKQADREYENVFNGVALDITQDEANSLLGLSGIKKIHSNREVNITLQDSVPLINADDVWLLDSNGNNCATSGQPCLTGQGVTIGIIDTGVDYTHSDVGSCAQTVNINDGSCNKVAGGYDFVNEDNDPIDDHGHGTHVAATAAGNGVLKGVAPDANIIAYKVLSSGGWGYWSWVIAGIERSADPNQDGNFDDHLDIISLSLGGEGDPDDPISTSIDNVVGAGVVAVIAAGNSGPSEKTIGSPGTARKAITIGATDKSDALAWFSSRGPVEWTDANGNIQTIIKPDIVAPGVDICAAQWDNAWQDRECLDTEHTAISGTSMATPHVSGAVALIKQAHPDWTPEEIKTVLKNTAVDLGYSVIEQGYGRIDVLNAINSGKLPIAILETGGEVSGTIDIRGTAKGENFANYTLYYGYYGGGKNEIITSTIPVENGILYLGFDTTLLSEGDTIVSLVVRTTDGTESEEKNILTINNIEITSPLNNDIYRLGDIVEIKGKVTGIDDFSFQFEDPNGLWLSDGFVLTGNREGVLATFDSNVLPKSGLYLIRTVANSYEYIENLYFDSTLKQGWPQRIEWEYSNEQQSLINLNSNTEFYTFPVNSGNLQIEGSVTTLTKNEFMQQLSNESSIFSQGFYYWAGMLGPVVSDINNDGYKEIIIFKGGNPPKLQAYKHDGSLLWQANVGSYDSPGGNLHIPLIGDLNNDGFDEIITYNYNGYNPESELFAFNHDGSLLWSVLVTKDFKPTMLMADLDFDGNKEIVVKGNSGAPYEKMTIVNNNGQVINFWSIEDGNWGATIVGSPAVGNFDDDSDLEIVVAGPTEEAGGIWENQTFVGWDNTGVIYVYNLDGTLVSGWPVYTSGVIFSSPVIGDINNNGKDEIVVGMMYASDIFPDERYGGLYAFDRKGKILPGWPVEKGWNFWSTPSLADLDNNGDLEIISSKLGFTTYVFNHGGNIFNGWPQYTGWNDYYSTISADINNDSSLDVLTTAGSWIANGGVYAWNSDGTLIEGFPKTTEVDAQAPATVVDIDNDGKLELIASSDFDIDLTKWIDKFRGSIYVWELEGDYNPDLMPWPTFMHDTQHTGCYNCSFSEPIIPPPSTQLKYVLQSDTTYDPTRVLLDLNAFKPRCSCDTNGDTKNCGNEFTPTTTFKPSQCYDLYDASTSFLGRTRLLNGVRTYELK